MQKPEAKKAVVFLAYSADWPKKENVNTAGSVSAFSRQWKQLEDPGEEAANEKGACKWGNWSSMSAISAWFSHRAPHRRRL